MRAYASETARQHIFDASFLLARASRPASRRHAAHHHATNTRDRCEHASPKHPSPDGSISWLTEVSESEYCTNHVRFGSAPNLYRFREFVLENDEHADRYTNFLLLLFPCARSLRSDRKPNKHASTAPPASGTEESAVLLETRRATLKG